MKLYTKHLTRGEKETMKRILLDEGNSLEEVITENSKRFPIRDIARVATGIPGMYGLNTMCIWWLFESMLHVGHQAVLEALKKPPNTKLNTRKKPEGIDNVYDWFVENHKIQITQILRDGGSIRSIVRDFNEAYYPNSKNDHGLKPIRLRIQKIEPGPTDTNNFINQHPQLRKRIKDGEPATELYPTAQVHGYTKSLRTFQREVKNVREKG